jgi:hypothetical protein
MIISCHSRWLVRLSLVLTCSLALIACLNPAAAAASPGPLVHRSTYRPLLSTRQDRVGKEIGTLAGKVTIMPGFPVMTTETPGTYQSGPGINVLVGDITGDGQPDLLASSLANGPLYAWEPNGQLISGWPVTLFTGAVYAALGKLSKSIPGLQVVAGDTNGNLAAMNGHGNVLPGWPIKTTNYTATPPTLADINGNGIDDIFVDEENGTLAGYDPQGKPLPGWPVQVKNSQQVFTPTIADIDGDGKPEIIAADQPAYPGGVQIYAWHSDGTLVKGFPIDDPNGMEETFPVVADVLGLGKPQVIFEAKFPYPHHINLTKVLIYSGAGVLLKKITIPGRTFYGTSIAIAKLGNSPNPDIVVQTNTTLAVMDGNGSYLPGWPLTLPCASGINSAPVVGDVTGDGVPDIAITCNKGSVQGYVVVYSETGTLELKMQLEIGDGAGVPAMADLLGNGRTDLLVTGAPWDGTSHQYPKVYALDFHGAGPYGKVPWPQFGLDPEHHSCFPKKASFCTG